MRNSNELLDQTRIILNDRSNLYGNSRTNHERISELWSGYLGNYISPMQVSLMQLLVKVSRLAETPSHEDSLQDILGYACIYADLLNGFENDFPNELKAVQNGV